MPWGTYWKMWYWVLTFTVLSTVSVYLASIGEINGKLNILNLTQIYFFLIKKIKSDFFKVI